MDKKEMKEKLKEVHMNQFQDLFTTIMKKKYGSKFQGIENYGKDGDKKVDGRLEKTIFFQVYAPEVYKESNVKSKIKNDFQSFMKHRENGHWKKAAKMIFVIKTNRNKGLTPGICEIVNDLETKHDFHIETWVLEDIYNIIDELPEANVPEDIKEQLCEKISKLKGVYEFLFEEGFSHSGNGNLLFVEYEEANNEIRKDHFNYLKQLNNEIKLIVTDNYKKIHSAKLGKVLEKLANLCPSFDGSIFDLPAAYEELLKEKLHNKRINLCKKLLKMLSN